MFRQDSLTGGKAWYNPPVFLGRVIGHVWGAQRWESLDGLRLLVVRPYKRPDLNAPDGPQSDETVIVADVLGAGPGEDVIVAWGHAARVALEQLEETELPRHAVDAAVVAIVDNYVTDEQEQT